MIKLDTSSRISLFDAEKLCLKYFAGDGTSSVKQTSNLTPIQEVNKLSVEENKQYIKKTIITTTTTTTTKTSSNNKLDEKLDVIRRIFKKIDSDNTGYLTEDEVPELLKESYQQMGMEFEPSEEDVKAWMEMADRDQDGKVTLEDYEILVKKSFKHQGLNYE